MFSTFRGAFEFGHSLPVPPVVYYNPNNVSSYPGSGTTVNSLCPTNLSGTLSNVSYSSSSFNFNGTNSYISIADNSRYEPDTGDFSVEAWVYHSTITGSSRVILGKTDNGGLSSSWSYGLRTNSTGSTYFEVGNGSTSVTSPSATLSTGQWYHVVGVWNILSTKTIGLYINGVSQGTNSHTFTSIKNSSNPLYLGSYNGGEYSQPLSGNLGVVRIYKYALSSSNVLLAYNSSSYSFKPFSFSYTGADQIWTVPNGVTSITVTVKGASGGNTNVNAFGGAGASVTTTIAVTSGDTLRLVVGGKGGDGVNNSTTNVTGPYGGGGYGGRSGGSTTFSGAAGGGYSGIFKLNTISVANALVIAGGGGGAGSWTTTVCSGGAAGTSGNASDGIGNYSGNHVGGYAATTSSNGAAATPFDAQSVNPAAGTQLAGGHGGEVTSATWSGGGGGGAGYYSGGGGAGGGASVGGGAGGTSYILSGTSTSYSTNTGDGSITITY